MFLIANRYCSKLSDCEDIVQDSVVNLCSKVKLLRDLPSYALPSYICYTVKNTAINHHRHQLVIEKHQLLFERQMRKIHYSYAVLLFSSGQVKVG